MSRPGHKARGKVTQKLTRDGLVERNAATGEEERLSKRGADFDIRGDKSDERALSQSGTRTEAYQSTKRRSRAAYKQPQTQNAPPAESEQDMQSQFAAADAHTELAPSKSIAEPESKLNTDGGGALRFSRGEKPSQARSKRPNPDYGKAEPPAPESVQPQAVVQPLPGISGAPDTDAPQSPLRPDKPETLRFAAETADAPASPKPNRRQPVLRNETARRPANTPRAAAAPIAPNLSEQRITGENAAPVDDKTAAATTQPPIKEPEPALKHPKESKLRFKPEDTPPEAVKPGRKLTGARKQADKSVRRLETAKSKLPAKKKLRTKTVINEETGKRRRKLCFESEVKPQGEHIKGAKPLRPVKAAGNSALRFGHGKMFRVERENVAVEAAHRGEMIVEGGIRSALRHHKTAPYRKVRRLEHKAQKKSINLAYQKTLAENPQLQSNVFSRMAQKRKIKKDYAKAAREAQNAAKQVKKGGSATVNAGKSIVRSIAENPKVAAITAVIIIFLFSLMSLVGMFGSLGSGGMGGIAAGTYLAEDADIFGAQAAYAGMEAGLRNALDNYEALNPGYDEYVYNLDSIWHDPYSLTAILSALHEGSWTLAEVRDTLAALFERQYILTETTTEEVRTRTVSGSRTDPATGETADYDYDVDYSYYIRTVTLENFNLSHLPIYIMGESELSRYALYMMTLGNRPDLFPPDSFPNASYYRDYGRHDIPQAYLDADPVFAAMIAEAEKWLGLPYVWGGYSPVTSFDCSGYVSWVLNQCGWNIGRLGVQELYSISTPVSAADAKPGDLIFFTGTYDTPGVSHVGIYVNDGMMLHCGDPIGYASINTAYWQSHFYAFGKLY